MSGLDEWQESNARQLGEALAQLRQRLERHIQQQTGAPPSPEFPAGEEASETTGKEAPAQREELPSALALLSERLGLSAFERDILLLCAAMELDTRTAALCARAQDDPNKPFPTFALALALFEEPSWDALSPERPLRYWRLLEINQPGAQPLTGSSLRADERIVNFLKGLNCLDDRVSTFIVPMEIAPDSAEVAFSQNAVVDAILGHWQREIGGGGLPIVQLLGPDPISKQLVAHEVAARLNRILCRLPVEVLPSATQDLETFFRLWQRESRLLPLAFYLDAEEADATATGRSGALSRFMARIDGFSFLAVREALPRPGREHVALETCKPTASEQRSAWAEELGSAAPDSPPLLAAQYNLNLPTLRQLARLARLESESAPESLPEKVWDICRQSERPRLDALAQRLEPKMTWDDLVLPRGEMKLLREIAAQVRQRNKVYDDWGFSRKMNRGFGISALFAGDSGCGKTMAAEVIANELRLNLYRIDLSAVVNKYIGETEKNLRRLFDAAEEGGSILFFDEADALFGKRSEVKDSHDRYANIEINYLLQRLESYRGLAILATNMKNALDPAFLRRLRFVVNFPFPGVADRRRLWEKAFLQQEVARNLPGPPLETLDYERLARLSLSGGLILNAALGACFMAAESRSNVTMPLVLAAARAEFMKLDRPVNETDFRWTDSHPPLSSMANGHAEPALV
ncbi:MAG: AAA family ATPase [Verrucomicrobia bacterium]|nr:MAG: AAA family ATPase [Verrucomicrobiota bacterium]